MTALILAPLLLAGVAAPAGAQRERVSKVPTPIKTLAIPFAPPLSQALVYDVATSVTGGKEARSTHARQSLRFERVGSGYVLEIRNLRLTNGTTVMDLSTPAGLARIPPHQRLLLGPMSFDVDESGAMVRVHNWDKIKAAIVSAVDEMVATSNASDKDTARRVMEDAMKSYLAADAEQAVSAVQRTWPSLLGYGGVELDENVPYEAEEERESGILSMMLPYTLRFNLTQSEDGKALNFRQVSQPDDKLAAKAITKFLKSMAGALPSDKRAEMEQQFDVMKSMKIRDMLEISFDPQNGLVQSGTIERRVHIDAPDTPAEVVTLTTVTRVP